MFSLLLKDFISEFYLYWNKFRQTDRAIKKFDTAKALIQLDGCPGWSESSLDAHNFCFILSCSGSYCTISLIGNATLDAKFWLDSCVLHLQVCVKQFINRIRGLKGEMVHFKNVFTKPYCSNTQNRTSLWKHGSPKRHHISNYVSCHYSPNFEEVDGVYWFRIVRPCMRASVRQEPYMLEFWNFIYGLLIEKNSFPELWLFENVGIFQTCQQYISKTIWQKGLKLGQLLGNDKPD